MRCLMYVKGPAKNPPCDNAVRAAGNPPLKISPSQLSNERNVISTPLATSGSSIDYATRMAKILARRMRQPVYVGCSMNFAGTTADEEMEGFTTAVDQIIQKWAQTARPLGQP